MIKKLFSIVAVLCLMLVAALPAFAAQTLEPGVYEVDVKMYHAEKDKLSMGNIYLTHTALLKVGKNKKTLTIATAELVSNMQFWYYKDGTTEGETVEVEPEKNVEIAGTTYPLAFEFPIKGNNEYVGVKFAAPIMPLSPSARIKIDYSSAKKVTENNVSTTAATTASTTAPSTAAPIAAESTTAQTTAPATTSTTVSTTVSTTESTTQATTTTAPSTESTTLPTSVATVSSSESEISVSVLTDDSATEGKSKIAPIVISVVVVLVVAVLLAVAFKLKKKA